VISTVNVTVWHFRNNLLPIWYLTSFNPIQGKTVLLFLSKVSPSVIFYRPVNNGLHMSKKFKKSTGNKGKKTKISFS